MLFSVVIPTYNRADLLPATLESIWKQTCTDFEVIVVDDGSTDNTAAFVKSYGDRLRYLPQPNRGPGAARNLGIRQARGEYVAFVDSDDVWFPWTLETFASLIAKHDRPAVLGAKMLEFHEPAELAGVRRATLRADRYTDYLASFRAGHFVGSGMSILRRDLLLASGGFLEDRVNAEDHDLILRLGTAPGFVKVQSPVTLAWRRHGDSETGDARSTATGVLRLICQERQGKYPGAAERGQQRREILTRHARPASLGCLSHGAIRHAWQVYLATFAWHLRQRRWRFVFVFPLLTLRAVLRTVLTTEKA